MKKSQFLTRRTEIYSESTSAELKAPRQSWVRDIPVENHLSLSLSALYLWLFA